MTTNSSRNGSDRAGGRRRGTARAKGKPLDQTALRDLALAYAARFATTGAKLEAYLARKIRERGIAEDGEGRTADLDVPTLVARLVELGYVDDASFARMKSRDLTARGYGARRVEQALWAAGVDESLRQDHAPGEAQSREAAALLAQKRRFGPYGDRLVNLSDPQARHKQKDKQVAAMLRAGHAYEHVRFIVEASDAAMIESWLAEAHEEDPEHDF